MIFIALGTQKFQFNRLLEMVDDLIARGLISEPVFAQVGNSNYRPMNFDYVSFLDKICFEKKIKECDILITHGGVATIIAGLQNEKKVIVVPRIAKYGEHVDDHQLQIAESFSKQNYVLMCSEEDHLEDLLNEVKNHEFAKYVSQRKQMVKVIEDYLKNII